MRRLALLVGLFALLIPASVGLASDGVLEINQACAQSGCFGGDPGGWPVTIIREGSYRLTDNLTVPDENTSAIEVSANDVSIDLNGFSINGPVTCSGSTSVCSHASGTGYGIKASTSAVSGTSVKNGSISGMGSYGVYLYRRAEVTNLRVRWNRLHGIGAEGEGTVSGNNASYNGGIGIFVKSGSTVSDNTAWYNGNDGIYAQGSSRVSGNTAGYNGDYGIFAETGSTVSGNTAYNNGASGIYAHGSSVISGNMVRDNVGNGITAGAGSTVSGNTVIDNGNNGIGVGHGSTVTGNTMRSNTSYGLTFYGIDAAYSGNVISDNTLGTVSGTAVQLGQNACNGNTTCP